MGAGGGTLSDTSVTKEPTRIARDTDDLDAQFDAIVDALRREVRRLRQQVDRFGRTYQKQAEERSRRESDDADQTIQRSYRRLKQLQLVVQHIESSAAYLLGSGIDPSGEEEKDDMVEVAQRVLESLEAERERLYRDVHDGPAQVLANAIFEVEYLERIAERIPSEVRQTLRTELATLKGQFRTSLDSVRAMIYDLRPPELTELGLAEAMRNYSAEWEARCGIRVGSRLDTMNTHLAPLQELAVYRIMQEALQNVHKHAQASAVGMAWQRSTENWVLHVTDDGIGFDIVRTARHKKSVGLLSMRERAELIGGTLQIQSTPGKGTAVTLLLPTAKKIEPLRARREERVREEHS
ncbi:MAG: sensor histidine kinase [Chloroflexi bacterium]|nr:MAG: sensor histidine kinase [Chloroflexota bacterium]TMG66597.1 MAG: sensor histidine kinase [Chloroflexota bacterium]